MADTAYDADHLRQAIAAKGALAVIPNNPSRTLIRSTSVSVPSAISWNLLL
jgi:transposase